MVARQDKISAVFGARPSQACQVPCRHLDRGVRGARAMNQRRLLCAFTQEHQNVVVRMDPSQTAVPQSMTEGTRTDESPIDLQYPPVPMTGVRLADISGHWPPAILAILTHPDLVAIGHHRDARPSEEEPRGDVTCRESWPTRVRLRVVSWDPTRLKLCRVLRHGADATNSRIVSITEEPPRRGTTRGEPRKLVQNPHPATTSRPAG
jgi:hypothetical protein